MNGWNRLFVVVAMCWIVASPFLVVGTINGPPTDSYMLCADSAYRRYGTAGGALVRTDMAQYHSEMAICDAALRRELIVPLDFLKALVGIGDRVLTMIAWGSILIPLGLLWITCWGIGRIVLWVVGGFRKETRT